MHAPLTTAARSRTIDVVLIGVAVLLAFVAFSGALSELVKRWYAQEEYSHGFFIPFITLWLLFARRDAIRASFGPPSWLGLALVLAAAAMHVVGQLSSFYLLSHLAFVVVLFGLAAGLGGLSLLRVVFT